MLGGADRFVVDRDGRLGLAATQEVLEPAAVVARKTSSGVLG
jgi:hypothetical protein